MKKIFVPVAAILALLPARGHADTVVITLEAAQLLTSGSTAIPNGSLIELLADTSSTFGAPTAASFTGADANEVLLWSGTENSAVLGVPGDFKQTITLTLNTSPTEPFVGADLLLRWFPTLTASALDPGAGTSYGQFRTASVENGSNIGWLVPSSGDYNLNFITASQAVGGTPEPNSAGVANLIVAAIPEPANLPVLAGAFAALAGVFALRRRRNRPD